MYISDNNLEKEKVIRCFCKVTYSAKKLGP